jgi:outer membrane immunogenic protein
MKTIFVAAALLISSGCVSYAADLPVKAIPTAPQAFNWTGCYVGVNGGYGWNNSNTKYADPNTTSDPINGIASSRFVALSIPAPSPSEQGWLGGGTAGCNWRQQRWVFGIEGDFDGTNISGSQTTVGPPNGAPPFSAYVLGPATFTGVGRTPFIGTAYESVSLSWLSTVRGRVGFVAQDRFLLFVTGGLAFGEARTAGFVDVTNAGVPGSTTRWAGSNSSTMAGYTLGGGAEWAFADHWSAKAEYLWYDLGKVSHPLGCALHGDAAGCAGPDVYQTLGNAVSSVNGSIGRLGINYHFN